MVWAEEGPVPRAAVARTARRQPAIDFRMPVALSVGLTEDLLPGSSVSGIPRRNKHLLGESGGGRSPRRAVVRGFDGAPPRWVSGRSPPGDGSGPPRGARSSLL